MCTVFIGYLFFFTGVTNANQRSVCGGGREGNRALYCAWRNL